MIFLNYIKFKYGKLTRGDRCLYRGMPAIYLGTYVENKHCVYMVRVDAVVSATNEKEVPVICEYIDQTTNLDDIVCMQQQEPAMEGQMQLC